METNCFQNILDVIFILKQRLWVELCFVYSVTGETSSFCLQIINLHIYAATNSVSLWDYGTNKLNCIHFQCNSCYNVRIK